jgi:hypothetical protein
MTDQRKALARRPSKYDVNRSISDARGRANFISGKAHNRPRDNAAIGEIEFVRGAMNWINLNGRDNVKACLFEAQAHTPRPGKEIDCDGSHW